MTLRNERARQEEARRATKVQTLREHTALVFTELFALQHAINWITWFAEHDPAAIDGQAISSYDTEIHRCYPKMLGSLAMVAALSSNLNQQPMPLMQGLYDLEEEVAIALHKIPDDRESSLAVLQNCLQKAHALEKTLPPELARIIKSTEFNEDRRVVALPPIEVLSATFT